MSNLKFRRVLLKVSGEALANPGSHGVDSEAVMALATKIKVLADAGLELSVVVGGGNFVRGRALQVDHIADATKDYMGMLATVMNAIALQDTCEHIGLQTRVLSSISMARICEQWIRRRAIRHLEKGRVIILAAGTGNPHFTTDTAAAQRAIEMNCQVLVKATQVDGVYDSDPKKNPQARRYETVTYTECLARDLKVMDGTAIALCREKNLPLLVVSMDDASSILAALSGEKVGTWVVRD